ncbi:MAG: restriction endonuclease subunit S [Bacteroidales bacterium]|nr:restriction endonuclease subunit S [Bacteroidales bacterium]
MRFRDIAGENGMFKDGDWIEKKDQDDKGNVRLIQLADIGAGYFKDKSDKRITETKAIELNCTYLKKGDILITRLGEPLCKACIFPYEGLYITAVDIAILRIGLQEIDSKYLVYLINSPWFKDQVKQYESGTTRKRISRKNLDCIDMTFPPIEEQQRIVTRIEELFSELDSAVETLQKTRQQLEVYRQAVLKEAFAECESTVKVNDVCKHVTDGDHMPPPKAETGIPFIMISNIDKNVINWNGTAFVNREYYENINDKRRPQKGDVLYTVTGSFGIPVLVDFDREFCFQRHIALLRPNNRIIQRYLYYVMQEPEVYEQAKKKSTGTAQKTVSLSVLRNIEIPFVESVKEQERIVAKIESQLSVCDGIERTIEESLQQAEAMRQSILKKAFEGRL